MKKFAGYQLTSQLAQMPLAGARVLLRVDLNVPLQDGAIADDFRLQSIRPTLDFLLKQQTRVLIVTHLGRPKKHDPKFSTQQLLPWFSQHGYNVTFAATLPDAHEALERTGACVLLENVRFWPQEKTPDMTFARALRALADFYVFDAFGAAHRSDASLTIVPQLYAPAQRTVGFLVERELSACNHLLQAAERPFMAVIGGAKIATKLPLLENLLAHVDVLALLPPLSCALDELARLREQATAVGKKIVLPSDYMVGADGWYGAYRIVTREQMSTHEMALTIGPQTVADYQQHLRAARTVFFNGLSGDCAYPETIVPMRELVQTLCNVPNVYSMVAGGDSVHMMHVVGLAQCVSFLSTGGGACVAYLAGQRLPALDALIS